MNAPLPAAARAAAPGAQSQPGCAHCGAAIPPGAARFCCAGCGTAHALIHGLGLDAFYARLTALAPKPDADAPRHDFAARAVADGKGGQRLALLVDGVSCAACAWLIEQVLAREPDVVNARVNLTARRLDIAWRGAAERADALAARLAALGFRPAPYASACLAGAEDAAERELLRALGIATFAAMNVMLVSVAVWVGHDDGDMGPATRGLMHWLAALIALPAVAYAGMPFYRGAFTALQAGRANMDVPISLGILLTAAMSLSEAIRGGDYTYFDSAVSLLALLLLGRYLDRRARGRARAAAEHLAALSSAPVTVLEEDGRARRCAPDEVRAGQTVLVAAGERVGVDGTVVAGETSLDVALMTGEGVPIAAGPGSAVQAGSLNLAAPIRVRATATGAETTLAGIVAMMAHAGQARGRFVGIADRAARWYTPVVHVAALATFLLWWGVLDSAWQHALVHAVAVLIITCPCALGIAVPVVQVAAAGRLMRGRVLLKSADALERIAACDAVVLDKTGTLTLGRPALLPGGQDGATRALAASLAATSLHPLARALAAAVPGVRPADGVIEQPGQGIEARIEGGVVRLGSAAFTGAAPGQGMELFLARPGAPPVRFGFTDPLRADAAATVTRLAAMGLPARILSGDRVPAVAAAAAGAGIADFAGELDPAGKLARLAALKGQGHRVLMVGDGLNDAPVLAASHASVAPATGADITAAAADAVFLGQDLMPVAELVRVARAAQAIARQNIAISFAYNIVAVPLAVAGLVTPLIAAVVMAASSLAVIGNALRVERS